MRVVLDVNHPGDVHFIKNLYFELISEGHKVQVVASRKPLTYELLLAYNIPFWAIGSYGSSVLSKAMNLVWLDIKMFWFCLRFRPEVMLGTVAFRIAHIGWLLRIRTYCFDDTEHAIEQTRLITPLVKYFVTPINYGPDHGDKHIRYQGYHELAYLHPNRFERNKAVLKELGIQENEVYTIIRFVAWNATHDNSSQGVTISNKIKAVQAFERYGKVFVSSESALPKELESYVLPIKIGQIHDLIAGSTMVWGESSTMASEAACLGVPAVFIDNYGRCYTDEQESKYGLVFNYKIDEQELAIRKGIEIMSGEVDRSKFLDGHQSLLADKIDVTTFQRQLLKGIHT